MYVCNVIVIVIVIEKPNETAKKPDETAKKNQAPKMWKLKRRKKLETANI